MALDVLEDLSAQLPSDRIIVTLVGAYSVNAITGESASTSAILALTFTAETPGIGESS